MLEMGHGHAQMRTTFTYVQLRRWQGCQRSQITWDPAPHFCAFGQVLEDHVKILPCLFKWKVFLIILRALDKVVLGVDDPSIMW